VEDGGSDLASLEAYSRRREENPSSGGSLTFPEETSRSFFWGLLDSSVSNESVPSDRCSPEDMLSDFGGVAGCSNGMEGSDQNHL